jgi:hypothetical protein
LRSADPAVREYRGRCEHVNVFYRRRPPVPRECPLEPACWSWPAPTPELLEKVRQRMIAESLEDGTRPPNDRIVRWELLSDWMAERCAVCGQRRPSRMVEDHDHETGLFRGYLCRSCNGCESSQGGIFDMYRERSPAIIFNIKEEYSNLYAWKWAVNVH